MRIFADVKKKHSAHAITADVDLAETAHAAELFLADAKYREMFEKMDRKSDVYDKSVDLCVRRIIKSLVDDDVVKPEGERQASRGGVEVGLSGHGQVDVGP